MRRLICPRSCDLAPTDYADGSATAGVVAVDRCSISRAPSRSASAASVHVAVAIVAHLLSKAKRCTERTRGVGGSLPVILSMARCRSFTVQSFYIAVRDET